jgi:hypothetical protein
MQKYFLILLTFIILLSCGKSPMSQLASNETSGTESLKTMKIFKTTDQNISVTWTTPINSTEEGKAIIVLSQNGTPSALPNQMELNPYLWMGGDDMNHGSSPIEISKLSDGIYFISDVRFIMSGKWQLHLELKNNSTKIEDIVFEYDVVE